MHLSPNADREAKTVVSTVNKLYEVFASYPRPTKFHASPLVPVSRTEAEVLYATRLREISPALLQTFASRTLSTWGGDHEFKYFLPRMFELLWAAPHWTDSTLLLAKLSYANWLTWPAKEQEAVNDFLSALFEAALQRYPAPVDVSDLLAGMAQAKGSLASELATWREHKSLAASLHLAELVENQRDYLWKNGTVARGYLGAAVELAAWLRSAEVKARLEEQYFASPEAVKLSAATDILDHVPKD